MPLLHEGSLPRSIARATLVGGVLAVILLTAIGCGGGGGATSPEEASRAFVDAMASENYGAAEVYLINGEEDLESAKGFLGDISLSNLVYLESIDTGESGVKPQGEEEEVVVPHVEVIFTDGAKKGTSQDLSLYMVKYKGDWLITGWGKST